LLLLFSLVLKPYPPFFDAEELLNV